MTKQDSRKEVWALCRLSRPDIFILRYTLEAHEGLCTCSTLPGGEGLVRIYTEQRLRPLLEQVLEGLCQELSMEVLEWGEWTD